MTNVMIKLIGLFIVGMIAYGVLFAPIIPPATPTPTAGAEEITVTQEVELGLGEEAMLKAWAKNDPTGFRQGAAAYRKELRTEKVKYSESKKVLDALDKLEDAIKGGIIDKNDPRITNLWIQLIQVMANVPTKKVKEPSSMVLQTRYLPYYGKFSQLKLDDQILDQVVPAKRERFLQRKAIYDEQCKALIARIDDKIHQKSAPSELELELEFLEQELQYLSEARSDLINNYVV